MFHFAHQVYFRKPATELWFLLILILTGMLFSLLLGYATGMAIWGRSLVEFAVSANPKDYTPSAVNFMKTMQMVNHAGTFLAPALLMRWMVKTPPSWQSPNTTNNGLIWGTAIAILSVSLSPVTAVLQSLNQQVDLPAALQSVESWMKATETRAQLLTEAFLADTTLVGFLANIFIMAVIPAVGEELVFRGFIQPKFQTIFRNKHLAVGITAFLFSAMHLQFYGFLPRFFLGAVFGYFFCWTGSIWTSIWAHFLNNSIAVTLAFLYNRNLIQTDYNDFGSTSTLLLTISLMLSSLLLFTIFRSSNKNQLPD